MDSAVVAEHNKNKTGSAAPLHNINQAESILHADNIAQSLQPQAALFKNVSMLMLSIVAFVSLYMSPLTLQEVVNFPLADWLTTTGEPNAFQLKRRLFH